MRSILLSVLIVILGGAALAQTAARPDPVTRAIAATAPIPTHPPAPHCCREKVWDRNGHEIGDFIAWDTRTVAVPLTAYVAYRLTGGDAVALIVSPESFQGVQDPSGGNSYFTTPDCSGNTMFGTIAWPQLAKRQAMVLLEGQNGTILWSANKAWLWVSDPLPQRVIPGPGTVFHSQWQFGGCVPIPAPGQTVTNVPGGFWLHRVEDLYVKFKRPFYIDH
jgi:hypothetical protein